jgi:hypothetical protein
VLKRAGITGSVASTKERAMAPTKKDLPAKKPIKGGRKAGKPQQEF